MNLKVHIAQCYALTIKLSPSQSLHTQPARRMDAWRHTLVFRPKRNCRSLKIILYWALQIQHRTTTCCTIARLDRSHGKKSCEWRKRVKPCNSRCTHLRMLRPLRVHMSARPHSMIAHARQLKVPIRPHGNRRVHAMNVWGPERSFLAKKILVPTRVHRDLRSRNKVFAPSAARNLSPPYSKSTTAENSLSASADSANNSGKHCAITCFKCGKSGHVA